MCRAPRQPLPLPKVPRQGKAAAEHSTPWALLGLTGLVLDATEEDPTQAPVAVGVATALPGKERSFAPRLQIV